MSAPSPADPAARSRDSRQDAQRERAARQRSLAALSQQRAKRMLVVRQAQARERMQHARSRRLFLSAQARERRKQAAARRERAVAAARERAWRSRNGTKP